MAKRRKSYRGTPSEHRGAALEYVKQARRAMKELPGALRASNCGEAFILVGELREAEGAYLAHRAGAGRSKYGGEYALFKKSAKAMDAFRSKCVRGFTPW